MTERHHPRWSEVRERFLSDPEVQEAAKQLALILKADACQDVTDVASES